MRKVRRMDWLETRLRDLPGKKTKAGLARAIGKPPSRISEIVRGTRQIQQDEWRPMAAYLEWTVGELHDVLLRISGGTALNMSKRGHPVLSSRPGGSQLVERYAPLSSAERLVPVRESVELFSGDASFFITKRIIENFMSPGAGDRSFSFFIQTDDAYPYDRGDRILVNPDVPLTIGKHVVFLSAEDAEGKQLGVIATLRGFTVLTWTVETMVRKGGALHPKTYDLSRKEWPKCHRIVGARHS